MMCDRFPDEINGRLTFAYAFPGCIDKNAEWLRRHKDKWSDNREVRGAIAGAIMPENAREAALRTGLYVIERSGDTMRIEEPKKARGWRRGLSPAGAQ
jgi:hypothetical protein